MLIIKITDFSQEAASETKGLILKRIMEPLLQRDEKFSVDFSGIFKFATPFFNNSFASLTLVYGFETIKDIPVLNISKVGEFVLVSSVENACLLSRSHAYADKVNKIVCTYSGQLGGGKSTSRTK